MVGGIFLPVGKGGEVTPPPLSGRISISLEQSNKGTEDSMCNDKKVLSCCFYKRQYHNGTRT